MDPIYLQLAFVLIAGLVAWKIAATDPFGQFLKADAETRLWIFTIVGMILGPVTALSSIATLMIYKVVDPVIVALVSGYNGVVLGATITTAYNFWMGSSSGSKTAGKALAEIAKAPDASGTGAASALLIIVLAGMLAAPGQVKAEDSHGTDLIASAGLGYLVADAGTHVGRQDQPNWERSVRGLCWGIVAISLREFAETKVNADAAFDGRRYTAGLLGAGLGSVLIWKF